MAEKSGIYAPRGAAIRLMTDPELAGVIDEFSRVTGLEYGPEEEDRQFAVSRWGFPPIPKPQYREVGDWVRNPPPNINEVALGHPIFYLEDYLSQKHEDESWESWSIRMFYTIDAAGYWDSDSNYIDFLEVKEYDFDPTDIDAFHSAASMDSGIDHLGRISEDLFSFPLSRVKELHLAALAKCRSILETEVTRFEYSLKDKIEAGLKIIGEDRLFDPALQPDERGGFWSRGIGYKLNKITIEYASRKAVEDRINEEARVALERGENHIREHNKYPLSDLRVPLKKIVDDTKDLLFTMYGITSVINVPIYAGLPDDEATTERLGLIATRLQEGMRRDNLRALIFDDADELYDETLRTGDAGELKEFLQDQYSKAWRMLRLALVNYTIVFDDNSMPLQSYQTLISYLTSMESDDDDFMEIVDNRGHGL